MIGLAAVALAGALVSGHPVPEGGDTRPCVTFAEYQFSVPFPMHRLARIYDTSGERVGRNAMQSLDELVGMESPREREVRRYPICADGVIGGGWVHVEFNTHTRKDRAVAASWEPTNAAVTP
jgi:hypothetical protein